MELTNTELDRKCAELIMGWEMEKDWHGEYWTEGNGILARPTIYESYCSHWHPSTDLNQAWQVVGKILLDMPHITCELVCYKNLAHKVIYLFSFKFDDGNIIETSELELSRAICLACIQAWEGK